MNYNDLHNKLFPPKEIYLLSCSPKGKLPFLEGRSEHYKRKAQYENLHLAQGMKFTKMGNPRLQPYTEATNFVPVGFSHRKKHKGNGEFIHFFEDDYRWGSFLWNNLETALHSLSKFDGIFAPDYSLYCDYANPFQYEMFNRAQIYKSRFVAAYAQLIGYKVIPVASCGDIDSFTYCYDGLPTHSILGFCGTGMNSHSHQMHLQHALHELERQKHPLKIIIYGNKFRIDGLNTPLEFIEDQISKFHRHDK